VSLNIKDRETHDLVKELAELKGTSLTAAVKDAVREALEREKAQQDQASGKKKSRYELLMEFANEYRQRVKDPIHSWEINDLLYDEDGLPK
jgi:antitoxin VapB